MSQPKYKEVPLDDLYIDPSYQRDPKDPKFQKMVDSIVADFYPELLHALDVAEHGGKFWVWDGQARLEALKTLRSQGRWPDKVMCKLSDADRVQQATFFIRQTHRRSLRPGERHKAAVTAQDKLALAVELVFNEQGLTLGPNGDVKAVRSCELICAQYGPEVLGDTLRIAFGAWHGRHYGLSDRTLYGLALLLDEFDGSEVNRDKALEAFKDVSPEAIHREVTATTSVHGSNNRTAVAMKLGSEYNSRTGGRIHWKTRLNAKERNKKRRLAQALALA